MSQQIRMMLNEDDDDDLLMLNYFVYLPLTIFIIIIF
jgi:hypothetical protein